MAASEWTSPSQSGDYPSSSTHPQRTWQHSDEEIRRGISYNFRYIGALEILESMRSMEFSDRSQVAKESIGRVCDAAGIRTASKRKRIEKRIAEVMGQVDLNRAGADVSLVVDTDKIQILLLDTREVIASHELPEISFASGGDSDTIDFMAYVGKSSDRSTSLPGRWCYVLECGANLTGECVSTIGHAFDIRFRQYLRASQSNLTATSHSGSSSRYSGQPTRTAAATPKTKWTAKKPLAKIESAGESEYYNDMPGKAPPVSGVPSASLDQTVPNQNRHPLLSHSSPDVLTIADKKTDSNLIDLNSPSYDKAKHLSIFKETEQSVVPTSPEVSFKDPFDVTKIEHLLQVPLHTCPWYHGRITREEAEYHIKRDGDFLIRDGKPQIDGIVGPKEQFVLSGMHNGLKCHILLVDYDGVIRARNQTFHSIPQLVQLHVASKEPIVSGDSEIFLIRPVPVAQNLNRH